METLNPGFFMPAGFEAFVESRLLAAERSEFTDEMFALLTATPLIIIDGEAGPVPAGDLPLYRLPDLLLGLLGEERPTVMGLTRTPPGLSIRPLPGMQYAINDGMMTVCRGSENDPPPCTGVTHWLDAVEKLTEDLYSGRQYLLQRTVPAPEALPL